MIDVSPKHSIHSGACDNFRPSDDEILADLKTGLDLIDTDRTAAKVYLDRATRALGKHLIEVSPCLL